jgi:hypothetical protein
MRNVSDWTREISLNLSLVRYHVESGLKTGDATSFAVALKEVRRTGSDLRRMQKVDVRELDYEAAQRIVAALEEDVYKIAATCDITREEIDSVRV